MRFRNPAASHSPSGDHNDIPLASFVSFASFVPLTFIALGSNIGPEDNLKAAATMLRERYHAIRFSSVYRSAPLHHEEQDDFLNAVARLDADLTPDEIYEFLTHIERHLKKNPPFRFGPRTIDLDLLLYGDSVGDYSLPTTHYPLVVPHPRMHERRFVLEPLIELLDPTGIHPVIGQTWKELLDKTLDQKANKLIVRL